MNQSNRYPSISQAIWLLLLVVFLMFMLGIPIVILEENMGFSIVEHPITLGVINIIVKTTIFFSRFSKTLCRRFF